MHQFPKVGRHRPPTAVLAISRAVAVVKSHGALVDLTQ